MMINTLKKHGKYHEMFDIFLFGSSPERLLNGLTQIEQAGPIWIATVNPEFIINALKDKEFYKLLKNGTTVNVIDGIGVAWGLKIKETSNKNLVTRLAAGLKIGLEILGGCHREEIITGVDLINEVCKSDKKVFFLGGWGDRAEKAAKKMETGNSKLEIRWSKGRPEETDEGVIKKINRFKPDWLFVAYGMKKQEEWIAKNLDKLKVGVVVGVGRSFDYYSGELKRAPKWVRKMGMEWLFSLLMEPKRWRRQLDLIKFIYHIIFK